MPFKSESQHRKFRVLLEQGKITKSKFDEWMQETKDSAKDKTHPIKGLPERVKKAFLIKVSDLIPGGYADDKDDDEFSKEQINKGVKVEQEHTNDKAKAKEIAKDHLTEHADYYDDLAMAEDAMKLEDKTGKEVEYHLTDRPEEKKAALAFTPSEKEEFFRGFFKVAGGPGSGVSGDNTEVISELETSPTISIGYRQKFMDDHKPMFEGRDVPVSKIKYKCQEKCVPKKLNRMIASAQEDNTLFEKPAKFLLDEEGNYHVIDGHHRALAAIRLKRPSLKGDVYVINGGEKKVASLSTRAFRKMFGDAVKKEYSNPNILQMWGLASPNTKYQSRVDLVDQEREGEPPGFNQ